MRYNVVLFDADETLFDYTKAEAHALTSAFQEMKLECTPLLVDSYRRINQELWKAFEQGSITQQQLRTARFERLVAEHRLSEAIDAEAFSQAYIKYLGEGAFLIDGAAELCSQLQAGGQRMAIITNGIKEVQLSRIGRSELCDAFECIVVSEDAGSQKPHPAIFDFAFDKLGFPDRQEVLIVGDSLTSDIAGGSRYGIDTCWYNPGRKPNHSDVQPTYEIQRLEELVPILAGATHSQGNTSPSRA
ncbi:MULTISPECIES: YjjG family noncanonical pyrimidine nucleotidase [Paenibacillus]|uniref:Noncanonical pyrimidine nucleotidase, YjjG family n=1 Tax=Paenibacillus campinasensis TaxID=66347 RepID=A0A268ETZ7_9BACL|nr:MULTISPECIES: YjjG family noncanonical pyrimidine nucleotidase [Paenibacillus]PAD76592.1 noncanonical pyrimidine nucleotidase, YjjG family [Paenibacillus campinasensis]PAK55633.1 noncanonical pyrimidine nucleotidase, YjjG family [Paenibacillus sp. 7541]